MTSIVGNGSDWLDLKPEATTVNITGMHFYAEDNDEYSDPEWVLGTITEVAKDGDNFVWTLHVQASAEEPIDWADFENGGKLWIGAPADNRGEEMSIVVADGVNSQFTTSTMAIPFAVWDDDWTTHLPYEGTLHDDFVTAYREAYIEPRVLERTGDHIEFMGNLGQEGALAHAWAALEACSEYIARRRQEYWVAYGVWGWEVATTLDGDPNNEPEAIRVGSQLKGTSLVGRESAKEAYFRLYQGTDYDDYKHLCWKVMAHEIGHEFGLIDRPTETHLMGYQVGDVDETFHFKAEDLDLLREGVADPAGGDSCFRAVDVPPPYS